MSLDALWPQNYRVCSVMRSDGQDTVSSFCCSLLGAWSTSQSYVDIRLFRLRWVVSHPSHKLRRQFRSQIHLDYNVLTGEISGRPSSASRSKRSTLLSAFQESNFPQLIHLCCCSMVGLGKAPIHSNVDTTRVPRHMALRRRFSRQCSMARNS